MNNKVTTVLPVGPIDANIMLVGEQPGRTEVKYGRPFEGAAGKVLNDCLQHAEIMRGDCYITNVIKDLDHPLEYYLQRNNKGVVFPHNDYVEYVQILKEEILKVKPNIIVALGNVALYTLTSRWGILKWRGSIVDSTLVPGVKVIGCIHPAMVLYGATAEKHLITFDLKRALEYSHSAELPTEKMEINLRPDYRKVMAFLTYLYDVGTKDGIIIDYDIEVVNMQVSCISFTANINGSAVSMCIPFTDYVGDYFTEEEELSVVLAIGKILENDHIQKRGQNLVFDAHFLLKRFGFKIRNLHDTMIAQKILCPDFKVGLDFITSIYTLLPYYKDDGKQWFKVGGRLETLWNYNCLDSIATNISHPKQLIELEKQENTETYNWQRKLIEPLCYMMERGIRVDVEGMRNEYSSMRAKEVELENELNKLVGRPINPRSPDQLKEYFYKELGHKAYKKKGKDTTDDDAMKRLARNGIREASLVQKIRKLRKLSSSYLDIAKVDTDGRIRCSFNPVGTRYSRLSSSENIFGTGMNMQNWPHSLLKFLIADEGYVIYNMDLSQIENRIVAYVGRVTPMIEAFETGKDVHTLTAALIFGKHVDDVTKVDGTCSLGDGTHSERFWGKKANHGLNYGQGFRKFALQCEITEAQGKWIVDRYHLTYPEIKQNYHTEIRRQLMESRTLTNLFDRRTLFLGDWEESLFNEAYACIPQGSCGDLMNRYGICFMYYNQDLFAEAELLNQVHDSIVFQVPLSIPFSRHAEMILELKKSLERELVTSHGLAFRIPVDLTMGYSLCGENGYELKSKNIPNDRFELAKLLEAGKTKLDKGEIK